MTRLNEDLAACVCENTFTWNTLQTAQEQAELHRDAHLPTLHT